MMDNKDFIDHQGRVTAVNPEKSTVTVTLLEEAECGECPAGKLCNNFSPDRNVMEIPVRNPEIFKVGEFVTVKAAERIHRKAIMIVTVIPSIALIVVMIGVFLLTGSQLAASLSALGAMILFFGGLFMIRKKLAHEFVFYLEKTVPGEAGESE